VTLANNHHYKNVGASGGRRMSIFNDTHPLFALFGTLIWEALIVPYFA